MVISSSPSGSSLWRKLASSLSNSAWHYVERTRKPPVEKEIVQRVDMRLIERLCSIPGVDVVTAWTRIADLGTNMRVFQSPEHAASWAGLCPGNHDSGGKRLSNRIRKGNRWLRRALV